MGNPQVQVGHIYEKHGAFHVRFYVHSEGMRKQRSRLLCIKTESTPSKDSPEVLTLAAQLMAQINEANAVNNSQSHHVCPICRNRCPRNISGKFTKKV
jgi:hypothetical protein